MPVPRRSCDVDLRRTIFAVFLIFTSSLSLFQPAEAHEGGVYIVGFETLPGAAEESRLAGLGFHVVEHFPVAKAVLVSGAGTPEDIALVPGVVSVAPEERLAANLFRSKETIDLDVTLASDAGRGAGVTVAVVDTGVDAEHPGLSASLVQSLRLGANGVSPAEGDADGHGTHVAGIIAGTGAESTSMRMSGVAPGVRLLSLDISESFTTTNALRAFQWIHEHGHDEGIRIVSNSWGREGGPDRFDANDPVVRASSALVRDGFLVIFSAGNRGAAGGALTIEAMNPDVLTVGATDSDGRPEEYSSHGPVLDAAGNRLPWEKPDLLAPGTAVFSAKTSRGAGCDGESACYVAMSGTSMAAPHVAGVAAIIMSKHPALSASEVSEIIEASARDVGAAGRDSETGAGLIDAGSAMSFAASLAGEYGTRRVEVPIRAEGAFTSALGFELSGAQVVATDGNDITVPIVVPEGAKRMSWRFTWSDPAADYYVYLESPAGVSGPYGPTTADAVDGTLEGDLDAGTYILRAHPTTAVANTRYSLIGSLEKEERIETASKAMVVRKAPWDAGGYFTSDEAVLGVPLALIAKALQVGAILAVTSVLCVGRSTATRRL